MSIRDLLSFLRPSKASVEPVSRTDDPGAYVMLPSGLARVSLDGRVIPVQEQPAPEVPVKREQTFQVSADHDFTSWNPDPTAGSVRLPPPQHPLAPEHNPPPLDWASWSFMQRETFRRGWSFARYAVKHHDRMACVFGIVRGPWGICKMDFYICGANRFDTLSAVTHLPSGMGCGLFTDQESAATACELATRLADDWEALDPYADPTVTRAALDRMHTAWTAAGLTKCATHAHATADHDGSPIPIWFQDYSTVVMGRPEGKLS